MTSFWTPPLLNLGSDDVGHWNEALSFSGQPISLDGGGTLTFFPTSAPVGDGTIGLLKVTSFLHLVAVYIYEFPFASLFNIELSPADFDCLPIGLQQALYEGMLSWLCNHIAPQSQKLWRLKELQPLDVTVQAAMDTQWFEIALAPADGHALRFQLRLHLRDAVKMLERQSLKSVPISSLFARGINTSADFIIGLITVTYTELKSLIPGSVVVMAACERDTCQLRAGDILFTFVLTDDDWCCVELGVVPGVVPGGIRHRIGEAGTMQPASTETDRSLPAHDLRITLVFDIGRKLVTLAELSQWREGALIELDPPAVTEGLEVSIRTNGEVIGSGDLVRIDDRIAVRITRLLA